MAERDGRTKFPAGLRVLAIDGDRTTLWVLKRQLQLCNYNYVTMVTEADTALDMLKERKDRDDQFDLVISEVFIPGIDGFKLLELISLEMDIPVIMLSANDQMVTMMKGIRHGACECLVKPAHMEQVRHIWMHAVRKSMTDPRNNISDEKEGANSTKKHLKNKKDGDCDVEEDKETSTQKRPRVLWSPQLHHKFVEAVNEIGFDKAVPKNIQKVMNVPGLSRDQIASHLQKYRIYIRKKNEGTLKHSNPFVDEPQAWMSDRVQSSSSFVGASSSSNTFARMSFPFAFGTHNLLPSQSVQHMSSQRNSSFPQHQEMESVGNGLSLPKDVVPVPGQGVSRFISSGISYGTISSGGLSSARQCFPSSPASSSSANISNGVVFNTSIPFSSSTSDSSSTNISKDSSPLVTSMHFPSSRSRSSYASILRGKILDANKCIPFDADNFFEEIANDEMPAASSYSALQSPELANQPLVQIQSSSAGLLNQVTPSIHLPFQSPELVNQPSIQIQCSSAGLNSQVSSESHQFAGLSNYNNEKIGVTSRFHDIGHSAGISIGSPQGNNAIINRLARSFPTLGNEYQNQIACHMGRTTPMVSFSEHVAPFDFGSSAMPIGSSALGSSSRVEPVLAGLQRDNSVMPTQIPNGEDGTGNLPGGGTIDRQAIGDQMNNNNELPAGTSEAPNGTMSNLEDFLADLINHPDFDSGNFF